MRVRIDAANITDDESFHGEFARVLGFPDFYGANMDAWIDCMIDCTEFVNERVVQRGEPPLLVIELLP